MPHRRFRSALVATLGAAPCLLAGAAAASSTDAAGAIRVETLRIEPRAPAPTAGAPGAYAALLSRPSGWAASGPAVVVLWEEPGRDDARNRVVAALLDEGAAVLELDVHAARGVAADNAFAPPPPAPPELLPDLFAALAALRRDARAGADVSAVGYGAAGGAAVLLAALGGPAAVLHPGADGLRYAGLAALGPGRPAFTAGGGELPAAAEGRASFASRFCGVLALAVAPGAAALAEEIAGECAAALSPTGDAATSALVARADGP